MRIWWPLQSSVSAEPTISVILLALVLFRTMPFSLPSKYRTAFISRLCPTASNFTSPITTTGCCPFRSEALRYLLGNESAIFGTAFSTLPGSLEPHDDPPRSRAAPSLCFPPIQSLATAATRHRHPTGTPLRLQGPSGRP